MIFLCIPLVILFWLLGGQINKLIRPIGVPLSIIGIYLISHSYPWWYILPTLLYGFELTLGYGPNSKLEKWLGSDELVRIFYSFMCSLPVIFICALTNKWFNTIGIIGIILAFQIRAGSLGKIGKYDILLEDILRGSSVGLAMSLVLI